MKLLYVSRNEIVIYLPGKNPFTLWCGKGKVRDLLAEFLSRPELAETEEVTEVSLDLPPRFEADFQDYDLLMEYANLCM